VVAALREPVREGTGEAGAGCDDQQVAWIGGGAIGPGVIAVLLSWMRGKGVPNPGLSLASSREGPRASPLPLVAARRPPGAAAQGRARLPPAPARG
jgi:hypothetical protein